MKKIVTLCAIVTATFFARAQESFELKTYYENDKIGLLDEKGKKITVAKYDQYLKDSTYIFTPIFYEGLCSVFINDKMGFIDKNGKEVIPLEYSFAHDFTPEGLAAVEKNGKWGFINKKGKENIPIIYDKVFDFQNGKALVVNEKSVYFIDVKGTEIFPKYKLLSNYQENKILIIQNSFSQYGFLKNNVIYANFYDKMEYVGEKHLMVLSKKKIGFLNLATKEIIPPIYDEFSDFDGKYFYLWKNSKMGIIDSDGKIISPFIYSSLGYYNEGLAYVILDFIKDKRYGFIDENGKEIIPRIYDYATDFINGKSKVRVAGREFYIDKTGKEIK